MKIAALTAQDEDFVITNIYFCRGVASNDSAGTLVPVRQRKRPGNLLLQTTMALRLGNRRLATAHGYAFVLGDGWVADGGGDVTSYVSTGGQL